MRHVKMVKLNCLINNQIDNIFKHDFVVHIIHFKNKCCNKYNTFVKNFKMCLTLDVRILKSSVPIEIFIFLKIHPNLSTNLQC